MAETSSSKEKKKKKKREGEICAAAHSLRAPMGDGRKNLLTCVGKRGVELERGGAMSSLPKSFAFAELGLSSDVFERFEKTKPDLCLSYALCLPAVRSCKTLRVQLSTLCTVQFVSLQRCAPQTEEQPQHSSCPNAVAVLRATAGGEAGFACGTSKPKRGEGGERRRFCLLCYVSGLLYRCRCPRQHYYPSRLLRTFRMNLYRSPISTVRSSARPAERPTNYKYHRSP